MRYTVLFAAVAAIACGSSSSTSTSPTTTTETGTYALVSLDGRSLPATIAEGSSSTDVQSGSLTLSNGGTLRMIVVFRLTGQTAWVTSDLSGHYTRQGSALSFTYVNGGANSGSLSGDTISMTNENVVWTFRRS